MLKGITSGIAVAAIAGLLTFAAPSQTKAAPPLVVGYLVVAATISVLPIAYEFGGRLGNALAD